MERKARTSTEEHHRSRHRERSTERIRDSVRSTERRMHSREDSRKTKHRHKEHHRSRSLDRKHRNRSRDQREDDVSGMAKRSHQSSPEKLYYCMGKEFSQNLTTLTMQTASTVSDYVNLLNSYDQKQEEETMLKKDNEGGCSSVLPKEENDSAGPSGATEGELVRKRRKKTRWSDAVHGRTLIPGMPTVLPASLTPDQQELYLVQLQIEEINYRLRAGDFMIPQNRHERSPSPEPVYRSDGMRLNTREYRMRQKLEEQRHQLIRRMQSLNPCFQPPPDYKPPVDRPCEKVFIPQDEYQDINFIGLLIGPRGNTLKAMEKDTGARIVIRGKGSVKPSKVAHNKGRPLPGEDEPLHAYISAGDMEAVKKAADLVKEVIRKGIEVPNEGNDLRCMQLRELAKLNGTYLEI